MNNSYPHSYRTRAQALLHAAGHSENTKQAVSVLYFADEPVRLDTGRDVFGGFVVCRGLSVGAEAIFYKGYLIWSVQPLDRVQKYWPDQPDTFVGIMLLLEQEGAL
jgi:hypothetical protein